MSVTPSELDRKYADTDDPWDFRTSGYEQAKFAATRGALSRGRYRSALELGCGNGTLAQHLSAVCDRYLGLDAVERAVQSARRTVPAAEFRQAWLPDDLPTGWFDLIILSEILYFLDRQDVTRLARDVLSRWEDAEILCVTWLGDTGHALQGEEALEIFNNVRPADRRLSLLRQTSDYRIDRFIPEARP